MKSPLVLLSSLLQGCKRLEPGVRGIDRDIITIESRYKNEGNGFLTVALPTLCDALDKGLASGRFTCPTGFKQVRGGALPRLFSGLLCEVFDIITGDLLENPCVSCVKILREVTRAFKKLDLDSDQESYLDRKAKSEFIENDKICARDWNITEAELYVLDRVCSYILPNIENFDMRELQYKHGPGSVMESVTSNQKWSVVLDQLDQVEDKGFDIFSYIRTFSSEPIRNVPTSDTAKLISVPKHSRARRTITVEPCLKQFIQQGYNTLLRDHILKDGILRQCLALSDQTVNQKLALDGSRTGYWATLDLSSASDLLSSRLVRQVLKYRPTLLEGLFECRSPKIISDNVEYVLEKYAGMGNATTFPVQSIVFAVIAITALISGTQVPTYRNVARAARYVRVYGDDIIVPRKYAPEVIRWITNLNLKVNVDKSYTEGNFRESCGVDAFMGVNVTPVYVRHHPSQISRKEPKVVAHFVTRSNMYFDLGHYEAADVCKRWVEEELRSPLPLVTRKSAALGLHSRLDTYEFHSWNKHVQRPQLKAFCVQPVYRKDVVDGNAALLKFFLSSRMSDDSKHNERTPVRFKTRIVRRWVAH